MHSIWSPGNALSPPAPHHLPSNPLRNFAAAQPSDSIHLLPAGSLYPTCDKFKSVRGEAKSPPITSQSRAGVTGPWDMTPMTPLEAHLPQALRRSFTLSLRYHPFAGHGATLVSCAAASPIAPFSCRLSFLLMCVIYSCPNQGLIGDIDITRNVMSTHYLCASHCLTYTKSPTELSNQ